MNCSKLTYGTGREGVLKKTPLKILGALEKKNDSPNFCIDYYPFGLAFNSWKRPTSTPNRFKFQGQEHIDDLGLNWDSFKWRNHQPDIGRFFNVDPLAEDYYYNSPYAFSENRVIDGIELEGLEWKTIKGGNKVIVNIVSIKVINISSKPNSEAMGIAMDIASQAEESLSGKDSEGNIVITKVSLDFESDIEDGDFFMELRDDIELGDGNTSIHYSGRVDEIGNTQENRIQVNIDKDRSDAVRSGAHEIGHTGGLTHPQDNPSQPGIDKQGNYLPENNLMIQGGSGTQTTPAQKTNINNEIQKDTKKQ